MEDNIKEKRKEKRKVTVFEVYTIFIIVVVLFMGVAYAEISDIRLQVTGTIEADKQQGIFISNVTKLDTSTGVISDEIKYYNGTTLSTSIELSSVLSSNLIYKVSLYNNSLVKQYFKGVSYVDEGYDNTKIAYIVSGIEPYITTVDVGQVKEFDLIFKYAEGVTVSTSQILNSLLNFSFSSELVDITIDGNGYQVQKGATWKQFIESEYNIYEFKIIDGKVYTSAEEQIYLWDKEVKSTDVIKEDTAYNYKPELTFEQETKEILIATGNSKTADISLTMKNISENEAKKIKWTSSNTNIVEIVTTSGNKVAVKGKTQGYAIITASYGNITATCQVNIRENYVLELENSTENTVENYKIYGNSLQYGTPTSEVPVEVESVGEKTKNLLDQNVAGANNYYTYTIEESSFIIRGNDGSSKHSYDTGQLMFPYINTTTIEQQGIRVKANTNYTISFEYLLNEMGKYSETIQVLIYKKDLNIIHNVIFDGTVGEKKRVSATFTPDEDTKIGICIRINNNYVTISDMMLEEGTTSTAYEPYGYKIPVKVSNNTEEVITNIYLDEPLRKIGDHIDYIDYESKKVVRKIAEYIFNGNETIGEWNSTDTYKRLVTNALDATAEPLLQDNVYSNYFKGTKMIGTLNGIRMASGGSRTEFYLNPTKFETIQEFKDWLVKKYNNGTPVKVDYVLTTPTEEAIKLPEIKTYDTYTKIEVLTKVSPSNMELTNGLTTFYIDNVLYRVPKNTTWESCLSSSNLNLYGKYEVVPWGEYIMEVASGLYLWKQHEDGNSSLVKANSDYPEEGAYYFTSLS